MIAAILHSLSSSYLYNELISLSVIRVDFIVYTSNNIEQKFRK